MSSPPTKPRSTKPGPVAVSSTLTGGNQSDLELVRAVLAGGQRAIDRFLERMRCVPRILTAKNFQLGNPLSDEELEDVVQETLVALWRKLANYNGSAALETWVYRFCFFELLKYLRSARRHPGLLEDLRTPAPPEPTESLDTSWSELERIEQVLDQLPTDEETIVRLKHFDGLTFDEAGERLKVSANTAKTRYYRGMRKLRQLLERKTVRRPKGREA